MKRGDGHTDQKIVAFVTLGLVAFGLVMVYSATSASAAIGNGDPPASWWTGFWTFGVGSDGTNRRSVTDWIVLPARPLTSNFR